MELPKRKPNRLINYDYSQNGAYFITLCVKDRCELLWNVGARIARPQNSALLSEYGVAVAKDNGRAMRAPTIATVINQMKGYVTKQIGISLWQKLYHDHIMRNEQEYRKIWEYIDTNPAKWREDCYHE